MDRISVYVRVCVFVAIGYEHFIRAHALVKISDLARKLAQNKACEGFARYQRSKKCLQTWVIVCRFLVDVAQNCICEPPHGLRTLAAWNLTWSQLDV